jgi:hypothetical protein
MRQRQTFGTGDINLAAAMTTLSIPPDPINPLELIDRDNGKKYYRFHFLSVSPCGKYTPEAMSEAWSNMRRFSAENPSHPFTWIMSFIATRPQGCVSPGDWQEHAADFLGLHFNAIKKIYNEMRETESVKTDPDSQVSYICSFIVNRFDLTDHANKKAKLGNFSNMDSKGKSVSIIPEKASKRIKDHLLSHIR